LRFNEVETTLILFTTTVLYFLTQIILGIIEK
jgi:hypothetical protein